MSKQKIFFHSLLVAGIAVISAVLTIGMHSAFSQELSPDHNPPGEIVGPTFSGLTVTTVDRDNDGSPDAGTGVVEVLLEIITTSLRANGNIDVRGEIVNNAGNVTINDALNVTGNADFQGALQNSLMEFRIDDDVRVTGNTEIRGEIWNSTDEVVINDNLNVLNNILLGDSDTISGMEGFSGISDALSRGENGFLLLESGILTKSLKAVSNIQIGDLELSVDDVEGTANISDLAGPFTIDDDVVITSTSDVDWTGNGAALRIGEPVSGEPLTNQWIGIDNNEIGSYGNQLHLNYSSGQNVQIGGHGDGGGSYFGDKSNLKIFGDLIDIANNVSAVKIGHSTGNTDFLWMDNQNIATEGGALKLNAVSGSHSTVQVGSISKNANLTVNGNTSITGTLSVNGQQITPGGGGGSGITNFTGGDGVDVTESGSTLDIEFDCTEVDGFGISCETNGDIRVNTSQIQQRGTNQTQCPAGQYVYAIEADGDVTCRNDSDINTTYSAGFGLDLSGTQFSVDTNEIQKRVSGSCNSATKKMIGIDQTYLTPICSDDLQGTSYWTPTGSSIYYSGSGNVGIGDSSPAYKLEVAGSISGSSLCIGNSCISDWDKAGPWEDGTNGPYTNSNVGIGTTAQSGSDLYVSGSTYSSAQIKTPQLCIGTTYSSNCINSWDDVSPSPIWSESGGRITPTSTSDYVAIGTSSALSDYKLSVNGTSIFSDDILLKDGSVTNTYVDDLVRIYDSSDDGVIDIYKSGSTAIQLHGNAASYVNNGYSFGFGTSSPYYLYTVDVEGELNADQLCIGGSCKSSWPASSSGDITGVDSGVGTKGGASSGNATIEFDCSEVDGTGLSCSGETLFIDTLYQGADARCSGNYYFLDGNGYCRTASAIVSQAGVTGPWTDQGSYSYTQDSIGIGNTNPGTWKLRVDGGSVNFTDSLYVGYTTGDGEGIYPGYGSSNGTGRLGSTDRRWYRVYTNNLSYMSGGLTSDIRLKKDIEGIEYGLEEILALKPVTYLWKNEPETGRQLGLIAQEVREIVPEVVTEDTDEDKTLGIDYGKLVAVLISAVQELKAEKDAEIVELEERVDDLEEKLRLMELKVNALAVK